MNTTAIFGSKSDIWRTPPDLFQSLNTVFNFTLDPAATEDNHLCDKYYTLNGLSGTDAEWRGETVFCNPPYSKIYDWVQKGYIEWVRNGVTSVFLLPMRSDRPWFQEWCLKAHCFVYFNKRLKFIDPERVGERQNSAPFPSFLCIYTSALNQAQSDLLVTYGALEYKHQSNEPGGVKPHIKPTEVNSNGIVWKEI